MSDTDEDPTPPADLPDTLVAQIDSLELPELKAVLSYVEQRIESPHPPIEEEIEANAPGEVIEIENHGTGTLVRTHPPNPDGPGANTEIVSLYHVRREQHPDGENTLHWTYLGDVHNAGQFRCEACGRTFDEDVAVCPHCGSDEVNHSEPEN